jgi:hypothetical protein
MKMIVNEDSNSFFKIVEKAGRPRSPDPENERLRRKREQWREASKLRYLKKLHPELFLVADAQEERDREKAIEEYLKSEADKAAQEIKEKEQKIEAKKLKEKLERLERKKNRVYRYGERLDGSGLNKKWRETHHERAIQISKNWYDKRKSDPEFRRKRQLTTHAWYLRNREKIIAQRRLKRTQPL